MLALTLPQTTIQSLDISYFQYQGLSDLLRAVMHSPAMRELTANHIDFDAANTAQLTQLIQQGSLTHLNIDAATLPASSYPTLFEVLPDSGLQFFSLANQTLDDIASLALAQSLVTPFIGRQNLAHSCMLPGQLQALNTSTAATQLHTINLANVSLPLPGARAIARVLPVADTRAPNFALPPAQQVFTDNSQWRCGTQFQVSSAGRLQPLIAITLASQLGKASWPLLLTYLCLGLLLFRQSNHKRYRGRFFQPNTVRQESRNNKEASHAKPTCYINRW